MSRQLRPNLPGAVFHLTARLQQREQLFTEPVRTSLVGLLRDTVAIRDVSLFAYVLMPNHLHLVVRQGDAPLKEFMQPLLRRVALLIHRVYGREGHAFERRYRAHQCMDPEYLRNAIVYTHLNPLRAGLCREPDSWPWSSRGAWVSDADDTPAIDGRPHPTSLGGALPVFASDGQRTWSELRADYRRFENWRMHRDRAASSGSPLPAAPTSPRPGIGAGNRNWVHLLARRCRQSAPEVLDTRKRPDLNDIARLVIRETGGRLLELQLRSRWGGSDYVNARRAIILRATAFGYTGAEIATYLRISTSAVSATLTRARKRHLENSR